MSSDFYVLSEFVHGGELVCTLYHMRRTTSSVFSESAYRGTDLFGGKDPEAIRVAAEDRNKQLLFQAAVKPAANGATVPPPSGPRGPLAHNRKKRKGQTRAPAQTTHKRPRPQCTLCWQVSNGKGAKLGVTATWTNKPKV